MQSDQRDVNSMFSKLAINESQVNSNNTNQMSYLQQQRPASKYYSKQSTTIDSSQINIQAKEIGSENTNTQQTSIYPESLFSRAFTDNFDQSYRQTTLDNRNQQIQPKTELSNDYQSVSFNANGRGSFTSRQSQVKNTSTEKSNEVMISNIDRETTGCILNDLNVHDVIDLDYKLIKQCILIVKFQNQESANWAIQKYDGANINGRNLKVNIMMSKQIRGGRRQKSKTKLFEINENLADGDEDHGSSDTSDEANKVRSVSLNNPSSTSSVKKNLNNTQFGDRNAMPTEQPIHIKSHLENNILNSKIAGGVQINQNNSQILGYMNQIPQQKQSQQQYFNQMAYYGPQIQINQQPLQNQIQQNQNQQNMLQFNNSQMPFIGNPNQTYIQQQPNFMQGQIQNQPVVVQNPNVYINATGLQMNEFQQQNQFIQRTSLNAIQGNTPIPAQRQLQQFMMNANNQSRNNLKLKNQVGKEELSKTQDQTTKRLSNLSTGLQLSTSNNNNINNQSMSNLQNTDDQENVQDHMSDHYSSAFGYNSSSSGLMIQQPQPQQNLHFSVLENQNSLGIINGSIDASQEDNLSNRLRDDEMTWQPQNDNAFGSETESNQQNMINAIYTQNMKNISTKSDSDQSYPMMQQIPLPQYQSPVEQKFAMTSRGQKNLNNSLEQIFQGPNSGRQSPAFSTPGSIKHTNSFNKFNSSQTLGAIFRNNNEINALSNTHQGAPIHNRNFSDQQPFYQSEMMQKHQQFYMSQNINTNYLNQSMQINQMLYQNNYLSASSSDLHNNISQYGLPLSTNCQPLLSSSNSSFDISLSTGQNRKKKYLKEFKNHQSLKNAYSDSSFLSQDSQNYELDIEKIKKGEDLRTTIMIRNIPNKYVQTTLLNEINKNHQGKYDFLYLPIDFQNQANVGYAFINFVDPLFILDFQKEFHKRKWAKFNSQKICDIRYGRIQGLYLLSNHFKSSSVLNQQDEGLRPRIFEQNNKKDWSYELSKICQKYGIQQQYLGRFSSSGGLISTMAQNSLNHSMTTVKNNYGGQTASDTQHSIDIQSLQLPNDDTKAAEPEEFKSQ